MVSPSNHWNEIRLKTGARQSGNHKGREGKKGIRKILTRTSVPLELPANRRPGTSFQGLMIEPIRYDGRLGGKTEFWRDSSLLIFRGQR